MLLPTGALIVSSQRFTSLPTNIVCFSIKVAECPLVRIFLTVYGTQGLCKCHKYTVVRPLTIATVQTDEATLVRQCVTRGFAEQNLNGKNEASLTEAILNNAY